MGKSFDDYEKLLQSNDAYEQSDASTEIFDAWYKIAKEYASGALAGGMEEMRRVTETVLRILLLSYSNERLNDPSTDEYAVREVHSNAQNVMNILMDKPKFTTLLSNRHESTSIWTLLQSRVVPNTEAIAYNPALGGSIRATAFSTLHYIIDLATHFMDCAADEYPDSPIKVNVAALAAMASQSSLGSIIRQEAVDACRAANQNGRNTIAVVTALAQVARDTTAFNLIWTLGGLMKQNFPLMKCLETLLRRMRQTSSPSSSSSSSSSGSLLDGQCIALAIFESLHESLINSSTFQYVNANTRKPSAINLFKATLEQEQDSICQLVQECSRVLHPNGTSTSDDATDETMDTFIQLLEGLVRASENYLNFVLSSCASYRSISMLVGLGEEFTEKAWKKSLLPFIRERLSLMSFQGVSGSQFDQEIVNLCRECCRVYYLNTDRNPSQELGYELCLTLTQAIRHGYYETERFSEIFATILLYHFRALGLSGLVSQEPAPERRAHPLNNLLLINWLPSLFLPTISHNLKTSRVFFEILMIVLGLESSSFGIETSNVVRTSDDKWVIQKVMRQLSSFRTSAGDEFWTILFLHHPTFIDAHRDAIQSLVASIRNEVDGMIKSGLIYLERILSLAKVIEAMAVSKTPVLALSAHTFFQVALKVMSLHPDGHTLYSEEILIQILDQISQRDHDNELAKQPASRDALAEAMSIFGPKLRMTIASILPEFGLGDANAKVRVRAMESLLCRRAHQPTQCLADQIFSACDMPSSTNHQTKTETKEEDRAERLELEAYALAKASCPLLAQVAIDQPQSCVTPSVQRILRAAQICAENDLLNRPVEVIEALTRVAVEIPREYLVRFIVSREGLALLPMLTHLAPAAWQSHISYSLERHELVKVTTAHAVPTASWTSSFPGLDQSSIVQYSAPLIDARDIPYASALSTPLLLVPQARPSEGSIWGKLKNLKRHRGSEMSDTMGTLNDEISKALDGKAEDTTEVSILLEGIYISTGMETDTDGHDDVEEKGEETSYHSV